MKDEFPPALSIDEREEWLSEEAAPAQPRLASPPATREAVLGRVGTVKRGVYTLVRQCVDDFEKAAPWQLLYYPPEDPAGLLALSGGLITAIKVVPKKVEVLLRALPAESGRDEPAREDIGFLLHGIHRMVAHDVKRLEGALAALRERAAASPLSLEEGQRLCELSADLKGKYSSALMGAAASLIGEGQWNGVELEPVLFPEKAEEFRCTRELVTSLLDAVAAIKQLPEQVPFAQLVERWQQGARVDQYALADLPSLRGKLGRLLKERSRRALYSGDYHQISRREVLLSERINELERLHQQTWATHGAGAPPDLAPVCARLVQLTYEMAAVLDAQILKALLGEKKVNGLRGRAVTAKGQSLNPPAEGVDALVPLLAEDDLRIFFEMLLTAVQRRASLSVHEAAAEQAAAPAVSPRPSPPAEDLLAPLPDFSIEIPPPPRPTPPRPADPGAAFERLRARLAELQSPENANWSSFRLTQRLIEKHARLPVAMFRSIHPFLHEIAEGLVPDLKIVAPYQNLTMDAVLRLESVCRELCAGDVAPAQLADEVPRKLERILRFLDALRAVLPPPE
jgi:hypothetical protein